MLVNWICLEMIWHGGQLAGNSLEPFEQPLVLARQGGCMQTAWSGCWSALAPEPYPGTLQRSARLHGPKPHWGSQMTEQNWQSVLCLGTHPNTVWYSAIVPARAVSNITFRSLLAGQTDNWLYDPASWPKCWWRWREGGMLSLSDTDLGKWESCVLKRWNHAASSDATTWIFGSAERRG